MSDPDIELPEKIRLAERAEKLFELSIPGLQVACIALFIGFIIEDFMLMTVGAVVGIIAMSVGEVARYYKRKVMGP